MPPLSAIISLYSCFVKSPTSAMMWSIVVWLITYSPYFFVEGSYDTLPDGWKTILCFLPPLALGIGTILCFLPPLALGIGILSHGCNLTSWHDMFLCSGDVIPTLS